MPLTIPRCHASLVEVRGNLYLIGGRTMVEDAAQQAVCSLASIEIYRPEQDIWEHVTQLRTPRHDAGCAGVGE